MVYIKYKISEFLISIVFLFLSCTSMFAVNASGNSVTFVIKNTADKNVLLTVNSLVKKGSLAININTKTSKIFTINFRESSFDSANETYIADKIFLKRMSSKYCDNSDPFNECVCEISLTQKIEGPDNLISTNVKILDEKEKISQQSWNHFASEITAYIIVSENEGTIIQRLQQPFFAERKAGDPLICEQPSSVASRAENSPVCEQPSSVRAGDNSLLLCRDRCCVCSGYLCLGCFTVGGLFLLGSCLLCTCYGCSAAFVTCSKSCCCAEGIVACFHSASASNWYCDCIMTVGDRCCAECLEHSICYVLDCL